MYVGCIRKDKKVIWTSQHGFTKVESCLTNLITVYDEMTGLVMRGEQWTVVYLDFSMAFGTASNKILIEKLKKYGLD